MCSPIGRLKTWSPQVHYGLLEAIQRYNSYEVDAATPILIIHGRQDASVDYRQSERYAESRPNIALQLVESDHELMDQLEVIWAAMLELFSL